MQIDFSPLTLKKPAKLALILFRLLGWYEVILIAVLIGYLQARQPEKVAVVAIVLFAVLVLLVFWAHLEVGRTWRRLAPKNNWQLTALNKDSMPPTLFKPFNGETSLSRPTHAVSGHYGQTPFSIYLCKTYSFHGLALPRPTFFMVTVLSLDKEVGDFEIVDGWGGSTIKGFDLVKNYNFYSIYKPVGVELNLDEGRMTEIDNLLEPTKHKYQAETAGQKLFVVYGKSVTPFDGKDAQELFDTAYKISQLL